MVGAGIGGLTAAALLADAGLKVAVADHHNVPGGFCHSFVRKAHYRGKPCLYRFDSGPHDFSGLWPGGPVDSMLRRLGLAQRLEWRRLDHTYRLGGVCLDVPRDWHDYVRELGRLFPASAAGFETLFADIRAIYDGMYATGHHNGGIPGAPTTVEAMLPFPREHPLAFHWLQRSFNELVARHIQDTNAQQMLAALTGYISDGSEVLTCAEMMPLFGYYFHGGFYPVGGSGRLADVLVEAIEERGGEVWLKTRVTKIMVARGRASGVELGNGRSLRARAVVSNADLKRTFLDLVDAQHLPQDFREQIAGVQPASSAFMVHLGVDFVPDIKPAVQASGDPPIGIEALSLVDPTAAPLGHATIGIIALLPHAEAVRWFPAQGADDWKEWRRSAEYEGRKTAFGDRMIAAAEQVIPELSRHIVYRTDASPVTYARYDWTSAGAIYGISRHGRLRGPKSPVPCLVVAGSATIGPGVEAAVISGALAANALVPGLLARQVAQPCAGLGRRRCRRDKCCCCFPARQPCAVRVDFRLRGTRLRANADVVISKDLIEVKVIFDPTLHHAPDLIAYTRLAAGCPMMMVRGSLSYLSTIATVLILASGAASAQSGPASSTPDRSDTPRAQSYGPAWGLGSGMMRPGFTMGPGMMRGHGMWGGRFAGPCDPSVAGMAEWRIEEIERVVRPTDTQRAALADLRTASTKAAEALRSACPGEIPQTSAQRMAFMEKRMEAMLEAIKTVRPAFEAFYATMTDEQKAHLDSVGPRRWGWHWRWNG